MIDDILCFVVASHFKTITFLQAIGAVLISQEKATLFALEGIEIELVEVTDWLPAGIRRWTSNATNLHQIIVELIMSGGDGSIMLLGWESDWYIIR